MQGAEELFWEAYKNEKNGSVECKRTVMLSAVEASLPRK